MAYPVDIAVEYGDGRRSRGLAVLGIFFPLKAVAAIPHFFLLYFVGIAAMFAAWFGYWGIALGGSLSPGIARFLHNYLGWTLRISAWIAGWRDEYPGFAMEQPDYAARVVITEPSLERSRGLAVSGIVFFFKAILLLPHMIVLYFVGIAAGIAGWVAYWIVAFTGVYPDSIFNFTVGMMRWSTRTNAWMFSLTDEYPPFQLGS
ncbi:MAG: DUF4389 domain-containing protein [bacterium]|nr:DUF4389 domain-containing protein [bacterium]